MARAKFKAWDDLNSTEEDARTIDHYGPREAAEEHGEYLFRHVDYFQTAQIAVRDSAGEVTKWTVEVEAIPSFNATRIKEPA